MRFPRNLPFYKIALPILFIVGGAMLIAFSLQTVSLTKTQRMRALLSVSVPTPLALPLPQKTAQCVVKDGLPDVNCTPGAIFSMTTKEAICTVGYSASVRNVSVNTKEAVYQAYGLSYPQPSGDYEVDHLVPLELGGSNDSANLFPEAAEPRPGFREKDLVENYLHQEVCANRVALAVAQRQIATDWRPVYQNLTDAEIRELKQQYANWAQ
ncbi:HNH endonuclease [Candidatus Uhrbacteria bacterium CG10_big_fil_rev_8_21_14_0_10_48_11]|uniref:HNH endonuclease n=1 Tax=Candidatus Uhrbacteria bacterium CG10_big_fil_rev_8_21_14_0_10_48_11 TaxID=1975037 RepID=A0A2M8LE38_9BACT|nr:MAG: HNH endonuclease [Candidatus Uhrbacteria bacterium CG10_big_fil_rev_8_21_14_0_10_48_11]